MWSQFWKLFVVVLTLTPLTLPVLAEEPVRLPIPVTIPPKSHYPGLPPLTHNSGYIFAGTVKSVERTAPGGRRVATVQITFHVDQGMRGVRTGRVLTIREWAGLWNSGERYRLGERVLLFLYPPSKLGLTSPVQGPMGRFRIGPGGQVILDPGRVGLPANRPRIGDPLRGRIGVNPIEFVHLLSSAEKE